MGDLVLSGWLNLSGTLKLAGDGGKVRVDTQEVLVQGQKGRGPAHGVGLPVILPPPPAPPTDPGTEVWIFNSFNKTVTVAGAAIVTLGVCAQGNAGRATWPGMVLQSTVNPRVTVNFIPMNVVGDSGITLPNGGLVNFTASGQ
jgi:hypothetical protein